MHRILFVCLGNICRSPMAECVLAHMLARRGLSSLFYINSAATSTEEIGNPIHPGTRRKLLEKGVPLIDHRATRITRADYANYDLIIGMDASNLRNMQRAFGGDPEGKLRLLMDFTDHPRDVADPWYTGDFEATYRDVTAGCEGLLKELLGE